MRKGLINVAVIPIFLSILGGCGQQKVKEQEQSTEDFSGTVSINGTEIYCKVIGEGEPIVIVHGGPGLDHSYFLPHLEPLSEHFQLIFYDQRASGRSSLEVDSSSITMDNFVDDLDAIRNHFGLDKMNLLGHSFGGLIAMNYAVKFPDRLKSMLLVSSIPPTSEMFQSASLLDAANVSTEDSLEFAEVLSSEAMAQGELTAIEKLVQLSYKRLFYEKAYADSLNLEVTDRFVKTSGLLRGLQADLVDFDLTENLKNIYCPTLIMYGDMEAAYKVSNDILYNNIPHSQNWVIQDCGHFAFIEKRSDFERIIRSFMAGLPQ